MQFNKNRNILGQSSLYTERQSHLAVHSACLGTGFILAAIEEAVNDRLDTMAQGLEQRGHDECGNHNRHIVILLLPFHILLQGLQGSKPEHIISDGSKCQSG